MTEILKEGVYGVKFDETSQSYDCAVCVFRNDMGNWEATVEADNGNVYLESTEGGSDGITRNEAHNLIYEYIRTFMSGGIYDVVLEKLTDEESKIYNDLCFKKEVMIPNDIQKKFSNLFYVCDDRELDKENYNKER